MMRSSSPALSEISVGSPSPPPAGIQNPTAFRAINLKRLQAASPPQASVPRKSKSFSIVDILGKKEDACAAENELPNGHTRLQTAVAPSMLSVPVVPLSKIAVLPHTAAWEIGHAAPVLPGNVMPTPISHALHPLFPPALLHYDARLAWDYQRQLQEHFTMQAHLLRQMSLDPGIIPSEDGSERSRSNSTGSNCCQSPDVSVVGHDVNNELNKSSTSEENADNAEPRNKRQNAENSDKKNSNANDTPLDALFQLSTKNFDDDQDSAALNIFAARPNPKKKRKSRTAFTNHQIFELEKRFIYQKYLSPADRDEIAAGLGLSNAQVITWFQNRRAKLKRDMEELKKDVESVKQLSANKSFLENVNDLSILKTRPVSRHQQQSIPPVTSIIHATTTSTPVISCTTTIKTALQQSYKQQQQQQHQQHEQSLPFTNHVLQQQELCCDANDDNTIRTTTTTRSSTYSSACSTQRLQVNNSRG